MTTEGREMPRGMRGCDELREWLQANGYRCAVNGISSAQNECDWYAYKPTKLPARECECNEGKALQIVVTPHRFLHRDAPNGAWQSAEVEVRGEANGRWFKLSCYSLKHEDMADSLPQVEAELVAAWNAIVPGSE